jgi:hypothetical protein
MKTSEIYYVDYLRFLFWSMSFSLDPQSLRFVVAEIIRESDYPNRPGCHAGLSRGRVHPAT